MSLRGMSGKLFFFALVFLLFSTMGFAQEEEPNDTCATAQDLGALSIPARWGGSLDTPPADPDVNFYRARLTNVAGSALGIDLKGQPSGNGSLPNPFLGVYDSNCNLLALNDGSGSAGSRALIQVPADGTIVIAATSCCDYEFVGVGSSHGSYVIELSQVPVVASISGRVVDAENDQPLPGNAPPYANVSLLLCNEWCDWVNHQSSDSDGRFAFFADYEGHPLPAGTYRLSVWADRYYGLDFGEFQVGDGEDIDLGNIALSPDPPVKLIAAVLPTSRSSQAGTGQYVTAFASIINFGYESGRGCGIAPLTSVPAEFFFGVRSGQSGIPIPANEKIDIRPFETRHFVFGFLPNQPFEATEIEFAFACENSDPSPVISGLNTFLLSASSAPGPDIVARAATIEDDGIVEISHHTQRGVFAVAAINLGIGATLTVAVDTNEHAVPVDLAWCQTDTQTGICMNPATPTADPLAFSIAVEESVSFGIFVTGRQEIAFDPLRNRIFVRFNDSQGQTIGSTSVAVSHADYVW